jgi:hypothetical protein
MSCYDFVVRKVMGVLHHSFPTFNLTFNRFCPTLNVPKLELSKFSLYTAVSKHLLIERYRMFLNVLQIINYQVLGIRKYCIKYLSSVTSYMFGVVAEVRA